MRTSKLIVPVLLAGLAVVAGQAQTPQPPPAIAAFHGIGDLPGGQSISTVRDATKHNGVIYAVGASTSVNNVQSTNAPLIWTWDGTNAVLTALPEPIVTSGSTALAVAITRNAAFIASQVHVTSGRPATNAVRVTTAALPSGSANLNLNASPYPTYTFLNRFITNGPVETTATTGATAISDDGAVLYGTAVLGDATLNPATNFTRAVRFDINGQTSALIPLLGAGHVGNNPVSRGTSSDGSVMVGTSNGPAGSGLLRAFRYVHGSGVSAIDLLPGGTTNRSIAVSPDGNLTLVTGPSTLLPRGEVYLHNAATNAVTRLGSPMTPWQPSAVGGMTADGSVVAMTFSALPITCAPTPCTPPTPSRNAYIRNGNGWFHFTNVLTEAGVNIWQNWESIQINGMSPDGTLVFGQARHNEELEGFVAEFPAGYLASFDMPAAAPADTSIVGVWRLTDPDAVAGTPSGVTLAFLGDGTFFHMEVNDQATAQDGATGFERGRYFWNAATGALSIAILQDTNGDIGFSDISGQPGLIATVAGDYLSFSVTGCVPDSEVEVCAYTATRVAGTGSIVGGWIFGNPVVDDSSTIMVFLGNGTSGDYWFAQDGPSEPGGFDGIEFGTWVWNANTGDITTTTVVDTNGEWGFSHPAGLITAILSRDKLQLGLTDTGDTDGTFTGIRIVDPATVVPVVTVNPATVPGAIGTEFTYYIQATYALTFGAAGLPAGLTVDTTTGKITGMPTAAGSFNVTLSATNTFGATDSDILTIVIPSPGTTVAVGSASVWLGVKTSDDVGTKFDLRVEVLKNGNVVGTGQLDNVAGGSSGFNNAVLRTIITAMGSTTYASNDVLGVRLSVRIAAASSHRAGTARLWFGDAAANSRIDTVTNGVAKAFYLASGFTLAAVPGPGPKATVDVTVDRAVGGNAFKAFGTWTFTF